jgi:hypothetical protein
MTSRWWFYPSLIAVSVLLVLAGVAALTVVLLWPSLPSLEVLTDYRPKVPLREWLEQAADCCCPTLETCPLFEQPSPLPAGQFSLA